MWQSIIHADSCPMRKYRAYKKKSLLTDPISQVTQNLIWRNFHNNNNKVITTYYVISKIIIVFGK